MADLETGSDPLAGPDLVVAAAAAEEEEACLAVSDEPVSIWTTCLKEEVSAWTKVVGYGLADSDLVAMGLAVGIGVGVGIGSRWWWWGTALLLVELVVLVLWLRLRLVGEGSREEDGDGIFVVVVWLFNWWCFGEVSIDGFGLLLSSGSKREREKRREFRETEIEIR